MRKIKLTILASAILLYNAHAYETFKGEIIKMEKFHDRLYVVKIKTENNKFLIGNLILKENYILLNEKEFKNTEIKIKCSEVEELDNNNLYCK